MPATAEHTDASQDLCDDLGNGVDAMLEDWARQRLSDGYSLGQLEHKLQHALETVRQYRGRVS